MPSKPAWPPRDETGSPARPDGDTLRAQSGTEGLGEVERVRTVAVQANRVDLQGEKTAFLGRDAALPDQRQHLAQHGRLVIDQRARRSASCKRAVTTVAPIGESLLQRRQSFGACRVDEQAPGEPHDFELGIKVADCACNARKVRITRRLVVQRAVSLDVGQAASLRARDSGERSDLIQGSGRCCRSS